jgi:hypothetical protein
VKLNAELKEIRHELGEFDTTKKFPRDFNILPTSCPRILKTV